MEFDNTLQAEPSRWEQVHRHIPIVLAAGAFVALFLGLHGAATSVLALVGLHLAAAAVWWVVVRIRTNHGSS
jgi:hypothetical protein